MERSLATTANVNDQLRECPCRKALPQSGIRAWIKQGLRKRKKRGRETGKTEARRLMERKAAQQNKNTSEEQKQGLPRHRLRLTKQGEKRWTIPSHRMWPIAPDIYKSKRIFSFAVLVKFMAGTICSSCNAWLFFVYIYIYHRVHNKPYDHRLHKVIS